MGAELKKSISKSRNELLNSGKKLNSNYKWKGPKFKCCHDCRVPPTEKKNTRLNILQSAIEFSVTITDYEIQANMGVQLIVQNPSASTDVSLWLLACGQSSKRD